jgi:hypothetical protein
MIPRKLERALWQCDLEDYLFASVYCLDDCAHMVAYMRHLLKR